VPSVRQSRLRKSAKKATAPLLATIWKPKRSSSGSSSRAQRSSRRVVPPGVPSLDQSQHCGWPLSEETASDSRLKKTTRFWSAA